MNNIPVGMFKGMMSRMSSVESQGKCDLLYPLIVVVWLCPVGMGIMNSIILVIGMSHMLSSKSQCSLCHPNTVVMR